MIIPFYPPGRMISRSKSGYVAKNPDNYVIFNANICTVDGKIWYGDLDLTLDEQALRALREDVGQDLYILLEADANWYTEHDPRLTNAVAMVVARGLVYNTR